MKVVQRSGNIFEKKFCEISFIKRDFTTQAYLKNKKQKNLLKYKELF